jgi:TPR repeat protein
MSPEAAAQRHADGLALQKGGNEKAAFVAFLDAAEHGHPPAQRRLGEIYDSGNSAVERDYSESIRWYQKARENGEQLPEQPRIPSSTTAPAPRTWY